MTSNTLMSNDDDVSTADVGVRLHAANLFRYLAELIQLRSPLIRDVSQYENVLRIADIPREPECSTAAWSWGKSTSDDDEWLQIRRPAKPLPTKPPIMCARWVDANALGNPKEPPRLLEQIPALIDVDKVDWEANESPNLCLEDFPEVRAAWARYLATDWSKWREAYKRWECVQHVYRQLFSIFQEQDKRGEQIEVVLGLGTLLWMVDNHRVCRPLIVARVRVDMDRISGELTVSPSADGGISLEQDMLSPEHQPSPEVQQRVSQAVTGLDTIWDRDAVINQLQDWVLDLSPDVEISDGLTLPVSAQSTPQIFFAPVLILRRRGGRTLVNALKQTVLQIDSGGRLSRGLREVCGSFDKPDNSGIGIRVALPPETLLFPLPTNDQQREIVYRLAGKPGVLVQGPPGTGKSHTIVNLVSHFLAQGLRVLVTSQTPRALQVLREKIPDEIRPLSVSLLGDDTTSLDSLRKSVQEIQRQCNSWNPVAMAHDIAVLENQRRECETAIRQLQRRQRELREIETTVHRVSDTDYEGTASEIVQRLCAEFDSFDWLEDENPEGHRLLEPVEPLRRAVQFWREHAAEAEQLLPLAFPLITQLPAPDHVRVAIGNEQRFRDKFASIEHHSGSQRIVVLGSMTDEQRSELGRIYYQAIQARSRMQHAVFSWSSRAIGDAISGRDGAWIELVGRADDSLKLIEIAQQHVETDVEPRIPAGISSEQWLADVTDLLAHLIAGGGFGFGPFRAAVVKRCRYLWTQVRFQGRLCRDKATLSSLLKVLHAFRSYRATNQLLSVQANCENLAVESLTLSRLQLVEWSAAMRACLEFGRLRREAINRVGGDAHRLLSNETAEWPEQLALALAYDAARLELKNAARLRQELLASIPTVGPLERRHPAYATLLTAAQSGDANLYESSLDALRKDIDLQAQLRQQDRTLAALALVAPRLVQRIRNTETHDELLDTHMAHLAGAWNWRRGLAWYQRFNAEHAEADLSKATTDHERQYLQIVKRLASLKAWQACMTRLQENREQQMALTAWELAVRKIGKGTGKYVETYRRTAREKLHECRASIPGWIMPLHRVVEQIDMQPEAFDIVIVDEASQTGPEGLLLSYLAKQCIIVGDDKQISPEAIGINQSEVQKLQQKCLPEFPHSELLDPASSLFDQASLRFGVPVTLTEHFRCMPEIIRFSNDLCYSGTPLIPLRQYPPNRLVPIQVRYVTDGYREGRNSNVINRPEACVIVHTIEQCLKDTRYDGKTMGVIALQGQAQAKLIEGMLLETLGQKPFVERRLVCGDAYSFQGDERDVIFLSLVAAVEGPGRFGPLTKFPDQRRFNVAASRARDQMWLFHSVRPEECNSGCMRRKLIDFCYNPAPVIGECDLTRCESEFERDVASILIEQRYRVLPQYELAGKRIDLVVEGLRSRLAIECDGDRWHGPDRYDSDMSRQRMLERCGMRFQRVRGSSFYANRDASLEPVFAALRELGIEPTPVDRIPPTDSDWFVAVSSHELKQNLVTTIEAEDDRDVAVRSAQRHLFELTDEDDETQEFDERLEALSADKRKNLETDEDISELNETSESSDEPDEPDEEVPFRDETVAMHKSAGMESAASQLAVVAAVKSTESYTRMQLAAAVIVTLTQAGTPKKAVELVSLLKKDYQFRGLVRKDVNSVLYGELLKRGLATVDSSHRWRLLPQ